MAADDLYFLTTGDETRAFVLVRVMKEAGDLRAEASLAGPEAEGAGRDFGGLSGDLPTVLRDATEFAMLNGYDIRLDLNGNEWPEELGVIGTKD